MHLPKLSRVKDQGRTNEEPRNDQRNNRSSTCEIRTPKHQNVLFVKIAILFPSLIPCLIPPKELRETTEKTPTQLPITSKCYLLRLLPKKVVPLPKKVDSYPKTIDYFPKNFYSIPKKIYSLLRISCSSFIVFHP